MDGNAPLTRPAMAALAMDGCDSVLRSDARPPRARCLRNPEVGGPSRLPLYRSMPQQFASRRAGRQRRPYRCASVRRSWSTSSEVEPALRPECQRRYASPLCEPVLAMLLPRRYPCSATATCARTKRHTEQRLCRNGTAHVTKVIKNVGAGEGNRTLVISLEGCCSTIELHPRRGDSHRTSAILSLASRMTDLCFSAMVGEVGLEPTKA